MADSDIVVGYDLSVSNDYGVISKAKQAQINRWIRELLADQARQAGTLFRIEAPEGNTGLLRESFSVDRVKKNANGYSVSMGVPHIYGAGQTEEESKYPLFVHDGTRAEITTPTGNVMHLTRRQEGGPGKVFLKRFEVAGQEANPYVDRVQRQRNIDFGRAKYELGLKIKKLLES